MAMEQSAMLNLEEIKTETLRLLKREGITPLKIALSKHPSRPELVLQVQDSKKVAWVTMLNEFRIQKLHDFSICFLEPAVAQIVRELK